MFSRATFSVTVVIFLSLGFFFVCLGFFLSLKNSCFHSYYSPGGPGELLSIHITLKPCLDAITGACLLPPNSIPLDMAKTVELL